MARVRLVVHRVTTSAFPSTVIRLDGIEYTVPKKVAQTIRRLQRRLAQLEKG